MDRHRPTECELQARTESLEPFNDRHAREGTGQGQSEWINSEWINLPPIAPEPGNINNRPAQDETFRGEGADQPIHSTQEWVKK